MSCPANWPLYRKREFRCFNWTETNWIPTAKQFDREHYFGIFSENLGVSRFVLFCFKTAGFGYYASKPKQRVSMFRLNKNKQNKQFDREHIMVFFRKFRVVSVCFGLLRNSSVYYGCFDVGSKHRNKLNFFVFGFMKQTETQPKQILFRFVLVRGHPNLK
jgi:hypothetical protein